MKNRSDFVSNSSSSSFMVTIIDDNCRQFLDIMDSNKWTVQSRNYPDYVIIDNSCKLIEDVKKIKTDDEVCVCDVIKEHGLELDLKLLTICDFENFYKYYIALDDACKCEVRKCALFVIKEDCVSQLYDHDSSEFSYEFRKFLNINNIKYSETSAFL